MSDTLLEIRDLVVDIPGADSIARILDGVSLSVTVRESMGLVGESGCGKSMTALAAMGLLPGTARATGSVRLDGEELLSLDDAQLSRLRGRRLSMIFQEPMTALNPVRTIGDQVSEGPRLHLGLSKRAAWDRAREMLARVGLPERRFPLDLYPHELSGGQRQRVLIAMALACEPALLIADEPTTALDVTIQSQILDLLVDAAAQTGMALLIVSHDLAVIAETTDRMAVMYAGWIVEEGATGDVFATMAHPYTRGLFAAMPSASGGEDRLATIPGRVPDPAEPRVGCPFAPRCPRADDRCRTEMPPAVSFGAGHYALCFHPGPEGAGP